MPYQLAYASTAAHPMTAEELVDLLNECRTNNTELDVTGMLLYREGAFLQVIEGQQATIETLYESICEDERHRDVELLFTSERPEREFARWSMAFLDLDHLTESDSFLSLSDEAISEAFAQRPTEAREVLLYFRNLGPQGLSMLQEGRAE